MRLVRGVGSIWRGALIVAALAGLAGCSDDSGAEADPTTTSASSTVSGVFSDSDVIRGAGRVNALALYMTAQQLMCVQAALEEKVGSSRLAEIGAAPKRTSLSGAEVKAATPAIAACQIRSAIGGLLAKAPGTDRARADCLSQALTDGQVEMIIVAALAVSLEPGDVENDFTRDQIERCPAKSGGIVVNPNRVAEDVRDALSPVGLCPRAASESVPAGVSASAAWRCEVGSETLRIVVYQTNTARDEALRLALQICRAATTVPTAIGYAVVEFATIQGPAALVTRAATALGAAAPTICEKRP